MYIAEHPLDIIIIIIITFMNGNGLLHHLTYVGVELVNLYIAYCCR